MYIYSGRSRTRSLGEHKGLGIYHRFQSVLKYGYDKTRLPAENVALPGLQFCVGNNVCFLLGSKFDSERQ